MFFLLSVSPEVSQHQRNLYLAIILIPLTAGGVSPGLCFSADVAVPWCDFLVFFRFVGLRGSINMFSSW